MSFEPEEVELLVALERELRKVEEWPLDSPLAFVVHLAPRTRGKLGELLIGRAAAALGVVASPSRSADFDVLLQRRAGETRAEVKFSTEDPPRFQQVRNPRRGSGFKYDALVCISGRPDGLVYWLLDAPTVERYIESGLIGVQHQDSSTNWFFPSRVDEDQFRGHRGGFDHLRRWLLT